MAQKASEVVQSYAVAVIATEQQAVGVLSSLAPMQQQLLELLLLHRRERSVYGGQHQVHQEIKNDRQISDKEDGRPAVDGIARHHHIWIAR